MTKKTKTTKHPRRITIRKVDGGYRITGDQRTYRSHGVAFDAAWRIAGRTGADLYAIAPDGRVMPLITGRMIREFR